VPVIETVAVRRQGMDELKEAISAGLGAARRIREGSQEDFSTIQRRARAIAASAIITETATRRWSSRLDAIALHPVIGPLIFVAIMFIMFQAVFAWAQPPANFIDARFADLQRLVSSALPPGLLRSMLADGVIAGVGAVVVFLPQILVLFLFILLLESTGYMVRAAFLIDRLMARVGLSGHAFIPLLSSFACAVPGIMATRTIEDPKHRLTTILIAPLMTCSARLPVYAIIIGAFIPARRVLYGVGLQGLVLFGLYLSGIAGALIAASLLRRTVARGALQGFMMEMPKYQMPHIRDIVLGLCQRALIFLKRAGTIILVSTIILWALLSFPQPKPGESALDSSIAGKLASGLEVVMRPVGFNHEISLALIPAMAAREVAVSALATAYSIQQDDQTKAEQSLTSQLRGRWSLPTALAFLAWFVFAPQCLSTIAVTRRETNGWRWPAFMLVYLFGLAYLAAGITFWLATALGL
jgi:ferrous iron transport protein B